MAEYRSKNPSKGYSPRRYRGSPTRSRNPYDSNREGRSRRDRHPPPSSTLYIQNFPYDIGLDQLRRRLEDFGYLEDVHLPTDCHSGGREVRDGYSSRRRSGSVLRDRAVKGATRSLRHYRSVSGSCSPRHKGNRASNRSTASKGDRRHTVSFMIP